MLIRWLAWPVLYKFVAVRLETENRYKLRVEKNVLKCFKCGETNLVRYEHARTLSQSLTIKTMTNILLAMTRSILSGMSEKFF